MKRSALLAVLLGLPSCIAVAIAVSCAPSSVATTGTGGNSAGTTTAATTANASTTAGNTVATTGGPGVTTGNGSTTTAGNSCPLCVNPSDCGAGASCAQLGADSYCAPNCSNGSCPAGKSCVTTVDVTGAQVSVCVPPNTPCSNPAPAPDAGPPTGNCGPYIEPSTTAPCHSCSGSSCQPNGCYGGWWCDTSTDKCHAPPSNCGTTSSTSATTTVATVGATTGSGGGPVGPNGGTVSSLYFSVVGDTRPPVIGDTSGYPTSIITKIYQDIQGLSPRPEFSVSTGDYMFASTTSPSEATAQLNLYLGARNQFSGEFFPAMGNHECTGATASNCGQGNTDGITPNYTAFIQQLLGPIQKTKPYYSVDINGTTGWTSKFVFIAANAWDSAQASWLAQTLSQPTTYTFIMRHEPAAATSPGTSASEQIMAQYPYTMAICGHTHLYNHLTEKQIVVGNGGAPITGSQNYGFATATQRSDGTILFQMYDYLTMQTDASWNFAVHADGSPAP